MTELFPMEDEPTSQLAKMLLRDLNYKLLDEAVFDDEDTHDAAHRNDVDASTEATDRLSSLKIPTSSNRRRLSTRLSLSYEIDIKKSFVSSLNLALPTTSKPKISDFEPLKVLGKGAYGKVLLVREKLTGRLFAQKQLKKASLIINETNEPHHTNYQRTLNERQILEKVNHPNIVKLYYAFQDNNKVYLILEYLDGGELFHHLAQERFMSEKNAAYYIAQMVCAIRYLHTNLKVIYRDLKPENCMLNSDGNLVLTDFGLSKVPTDDGAKHSITGTAQYMAPEVLKGELYDFAVDWWSLGCVAYDLLTGSPPFTGNNNKKVMDKIISAKKNLKFPFYLSLDAKDFLRKLLQPNPAKRLDADTDFDTIKKHRFFRFIDWNQIENPTSSMLPPILPIITNPELAENFDDEFTEMAFTPPTKSEKDILHIRGFSFSHDDLHGLRE